MSGSWSREEVEATVADYLHMLTLELAGQAYNKTEHRRALSRRLSQRSDGAIERKHQNISAILIELGCPYISGYKPLGNYQTLLFDVVSDRLKENDLLDSAALAAVQMPAALPRLRDFASIKVEAPKLALSAQERELASRYRRDKAIATKRDYLDREARNMSLGKAGEEFVVEYERWRLITNQQEKLAEKIEHVSNTQGDGLGFDILSFETNGKEKLIEVKTTAFGKETPFFITRNEVALSKAEADLFHLYRVFEFRKDPRLFTLRGAVDVHCHLDPITYQARFS